MGTRSVVAVRDKGGVAWKGRYVHWDGYPDGVGAAVAEIVKRDGVETAVRTLLEEHYGWSTVNAEPNVSLTQGYDDGRFVAVPGYGVAYTTKQGQSSPDEWYRFPLSKDDCVWIEWVHVIEPDGTVNSYDTYGGDLELKGVNGFQENQDEED